MKKLVILPLLLLASFYGEAQQLQLRPLVAFGHSYESNLGTTNIFDSEGNTTGKSQFRPSYGLGVGMAYVFGKHWAVELDMMYSKEGRNIRYRSENAVYDFNDMGNAYYLRLPVCISYYFGEKGSRLRPYAGAGLSFGILLENGITRKANNAQTADYLSRIYAIFPGYDNFDMGLALKAGLQYKLASKAALFGGMNYYHGITGQSWFGQRNRNIRVEIGYSLSLN